MSLLLYKDRCFYVDKRTVDDVNGGTRDDLTKITRTYDNDIVLFNLGEYLCLNDKLLFIEKARVYLSTPKREPKEFRQEMTQLIPRLSEAALFLTTSKEAFFMVDGQDPGFMDLNIPYYGGSGVYAAKVCLVKGCSVEKLFHVVSSVNTLVSREYETVHMKSLKPFVPYTAKTLSLVGQ